MNDRQTLLKVARERVAFAKAKVSAALDASEAVRPQIGSPVTEEYVAVCNAWMVAAAEYSNALTVYGDILRRE